MTTSHYPTLAQGPPTYNYTYYVRVLERARLTHLPQRCDGGTHCIHKGNSI